MRPHCFFHHAARACFFAVGAATALVAFASLPARAQTYAASYLTLPAGYTSGVATSIADGQIGGYCGFTIFNLRGVLWNTSNTSAVTTLTTSGQVWGVSGGKQVGNSTSPAALSWSGTAASRQAFSNQPNQANGQFLSMGYSTAYGISGTNAVGYVYGTDQNGEVHNHAMYWNGLSSTPVDLHPTGAFDSQAFGVSATQQVGYAGFASTGHAYLWTGTKASGIDLNPLGYSTSVARATTGSLQAGSATNSAGLTQAALWRGSATSFVNLNPLGYAVSSINGAAGNFQVGSAAVTNTSDTNAFFWSGSAASAINLHQFLPAGTFSSVAYGIDSAGNIVGAADGKPVIWRLVAGADASEPSAFTLVLVGAGAAVPLWVRRRKAR